MSAITIENDLVHYEVLGRGRPVVFIHGWLGSWRYWVPTMQQLSMKYRTYALDLWGFGDSGKDTNRYGLKDQVQLLHDFFERLGIPKAALIGHSFGAAVCLNFARQYPERVHRMMLISPPLFDVGGLGEEQATQAPAVAAHAPASPTVIAAPAVPVAAAPTTTAPAAPPAPPAPTVPPVSPAATAPTVPPAQAAPSTTTPAVSPVSPAVLPAVTAAPTTPPTSPAVPPVATVPTTPPAQAVPSTAANPAAAAAVTPSAPATPPAATTPVTPETPAVPPSTANPKPAVPAASTTPTPAAATPPAAREAVSTPGAPYYSATSETVPRNPFRARSETPEEILARLRAKNMNTSGQPGTPAAPSGTASTTGPSTQAMPTPVQGPSTGPKPSTPLLPSSIAKPILPATGPLNPPAQPSAESVASPVPAPARPGDASANPLLAILTGVKPVALLLKHVDRDIPDLDTLRAEVEKTDENALLKSAQSFAGVNLALELKRLAAPTLLLHGENDSLLPPPSEDLLRRINAGKQAGHFLTLVEPELRHFPMLEVTAKFNRLLIDFLEATDLTNVQFKDQWKRTMR